jgi:Uma2 family endonuclease
VTEILSSTISSRDRGLKLQAYVQHAVAEDWIVDPDQRAIEVYRLGRGRYRVPQLFREPEDLSSSMLPNFLLSLADVFKSP